MAAHPPERGYSIWFVSLTADALTAIRFLALESSPYVHLDDGQRQRVVEIVARAQSILRQSKLYKERILLETSAPTPE